MVDKYFIDNSKYLGIRLGVQVLYQENYKNLLSKMKDLTTVFLDGQTPYYKYVSYLYSFMLVYKLNAIPVKIPTDLFLGLDK